MGKFIHQPTHTTPAEKTTVQWLIQQQQKEYKHTRIASTRDLFTFIQCLHTLDKQRLFASAWASNHSPISQPQCTLDTTPDSLLVSYFLSMHYTVSYYQQCVILTIQVTSDTTVDLHVDYARVL
jgi:hypothetical protein